MDGGAVGIRNAAKQGIESQEEVLMKRLPIAAATLLAGVTLALSACSSNPAGPAAAAGSASTSTSTSASTASTLSGAPVVVGTICSCSGPAASTQGQDMRASQAWAAWTNANGGINGHPVKLYAMDDNENPATGLQDVKTLIEQDHVIAIVGETSLVDATWASYADSKGVPVVGGQLADTSMSTDANFFASGSTYPVQQVGQFLIMKQKGLHNFGILYCAEQPICLQVVGLAKAGAAIAGGGISVTGIAVAATAPNYDAPCLKLQSSNVQAVFFATTTQVGLRAAEQCVQAGYKPLFFSSTSGTFTSSWLQVSSLNGTVVTGGNANYLDPSIPAVKTMYDAFNKYAPGLTTSPEFAGNDMWAWAGGLLFNAAAKAANLSPTSTAADVKKGLYALKNETLGGLAPPLSYTPGKASPPSCYFIFEESGQKLVTSSPATGCLTTTQQAALMKLITG